MQRIAFGRCIVAPDRCDQLRLVVCERLQLFAGPPSDFFGLRCWRAQKTRSCEDFFHPHFALRNQTQPNITAPRRTLSRSGFFFCTDKGPRKGSRRPRSRQKGELSRLCFTYLRARSKSEAARYNLRPRIRSRRPTQKRAVRIQTAQRRPPAVSW